jgi:uncharacterized membrane protein SpoIIM required for sporulation
LGKFGRLGKFGMDIDRYIARNQPTWDRLGALTARGSRNVRRLAPDELDELLRLYQRVSAHLSYARTYYRDPALTAMLTRLVARAGAIVYGTRTRSLRTVGRFFALTFPAAVWHARRFVLVSCALTVLPALAMGLWLARSDAALDASAPAAVREAYVNGEFEDYYSSEPAEAFAAKVFTNNVQVGFLAFAGGVLVCVPTAYVLVFNGARLGVAAGLFAAVGQSGKFWGLVLPHGLLELTGVFIAGATGLMLGWSLVDPGDRPRAVALVEEGRRAIVIVIGLIAVFGTAGLIEGFVTGHVGSTVVRVGIGAIAEAAFLAYIVTQGRAAARRGLTGALGEGEGSGWAGQPAQLSAYIAS